MDSHSVELGELWGAGLEEGAGSGLDRLGLGCVGIKVELLSWQSGGPHICGLV